MLQEMADAQAREGQGVPGLTVLINEGMLRDFESTYLTGAWVTLSDFVKALIKAEDCIRRIVPYRPGQWAAVLPRETVRKLLISIMKVPGRQPSLPLEGAIAEEAKVDRQLFASYGKQAVEIAAAIRGGASHEKVAELRESTGNPPLIDQMMRAIGRGAPRLFVDNAAFPALDGEPLPKTLRSDEVQKVRVRVASVNHVVGSILVNVQGVAAGSPVLARERRLIPIKCTGAENLKCLIAAQLADEEIEIHVGGELPTFSGSGSYDLQLLSIVDSAAVMERAIAKFARAHQLSL